MSAVSSATAPQVDGSDVGAAERSRQLPGPAALHHRGDLKRRRALAPVARGDARARRRPDPRRHRVSQAGERIRWGPTPVLRDAWQSRQLSGRRDGGPLDWRSRVAAGRALYLPESWLTLAQRAGRPLEGGAPSRGATAPTARGELGSGRAGSRAGPTTGESATSRRRSGSCVSASWGPSRPRSTTSSISRLPRRSRRWCG